ncbi:FimD/PapC C-terminal domain-containing protein [Pseudoxanthomonas sp. J35]|uniref:FimD/PapC C-terminal domain-containing protein n=1 Tax=Pseudoxanthomonas sp. J35 TaxID=935852 RepID=UPI00048B3D9B|nr:FimD/PapC C-terminal domain-containing protein [Pseudoxanthomonas sp. J35]
MTHSPSFSTDGIPDVPVKLENRLVGTTDEHGLLLVTPLNAWQKNDLSIDPLLLPADISVGCTRFTAAPATASGMLARFPMRAVVAVQFAVRDARGQWLAPGTQLRAEDGSVVAIVGHDGLVYLEDPPAGSRLLAVTGARSIPLPATLPERGWIDLGELQCH